MKKLLISLIIIHCSLSILNAQWVQMSNGLSISIIHVLVESGNNIFAGTNDYGVFISTDYGENWTQTTMHRSIRAMIVKGNYVFAGTSPDGIYYTTNNGQSWIMTSLTSRIAGSFAVSGNNLFAGTATFGVYITTNNGINWSQTSLNNRSVNSLVISGNNVLAGTSSYGVYLSSNDGQSWTQTSLNNKDVFSLAVSGNNTFAGTFLSGVYISTNNGQNWTQTSLNDRIVYSFEISGNNVFAGTLYTGIYVSTNNGGGWIQRNEGLGDRSVRSLLILSPYIFAGTDSAVWRRNLSELIGIQKISGNVPQWFFLYQNYPNPFNPVTKIRFDLPPFTKGESGGFVTLVVYDALGREVATIVNERLKPGTYEVEWDGMNSPSGLYFYKLITKEFSETKKMVLIK